MADLQPGTIQILEPQTFSITSQDILRLLPIDIPGLAPITIPPIGVAPTFELSFQCPMNVYCSADTPCGWQKTFIFPLYIPFPIPVLPALSISLPIFEFSIQVPPPIFITCPFFPDSDWQKNLKNKDKPSYVEPAKIVVRDPNTPSMSIADDALNNNTTVLNIFSLWS
jgi:hypothetical protein